jgi:hypothetical protein
MTDESKNKALLQSDTALRKEADEILRGKGLLKVLGAYGKPQLTGSLLKGDMETPR